MLAPYLEKDRIEAGCDEAGRGCLAGPVYAAAVILPQDILERIERGESELAPLNDSKQLNEHQRYALRPIIEREAIAWAVGIVDAPEIDRINILRASITAMHRALNQLKVRPEFILVDGNRFYKYTDPQGNDIPHQTIVKGDGKMMSIAAASILAKTYRDDCMVAFAKECPGYDWEINKGYPTPAHRQAIASLGTTPYHRMSFRLLPENQPVQLEIQF